MSKNFFTCLVATVAIAAVMTARPAAAQKGRIVAGAAIGAILGAVVAADDDAQYGPGYRDRYGYGRDDYRRGDSRRGEYASNNGYRDGYEKGLDDARDHDRYDLWRHRRYRDADHGYDRDYGMSRNSYRDIYRRGFARGYDEGYRAAARRGWGRDDWMRR